MHFSKALRLNAGDIVALVGGGGKSAAMFRLADELAEAGGRAIITTTTQLAVEQVALSPAHLEMLGAVDESWWGDLQTALETQRQVLVTGPLNAQTGKVAGIEPAFVARLSQCVHGVVIVEADGSCRRSLKAPGAHEPVIPAETTVVVPVMGAEVFGRPLTSEYVHRAEQVCELTGESEGAPVTPELAARVLSHPTGGLKNVPAGARVAPFINKVETPQCVALARETAQRLLRSPRISAVMVGAARQAEPVYEVWGRVTAIVLAAGLSTRMGRPKQLLPWGENSTMIGQVVRQLHKSSASDIVVVTGAAREAVEAALDVCCVFNSDFETGGMLSSVQAGLRSLPSSCAAALVALGDQPQIEPEVVQAVIQRWRETLAGVVVPVFGQRRGHPVLFDRSVWPDVLALPAGSTPRDFLRAAANVEYVAVNTDSILRDVDTPEEYAQAQGRV